MTARYMLPALAVAALLAGPAAAQPANAVCGVIEQVDSTRMTLRTRDGALAQIDISGAVAEHRVGVLRPGGAVTALGTRDPQGVLHAVAVSRAMTSPDLWPPDR